MNDLGEKVRLLREEKGLSRPVFCEDESELSVRQLVRIEKGEFRPTIKTLEYIANRLDIPSYFLMPDYKELPKRYQELKYFLLHHPDYGDKELQEQKEEYFDEILECFYDDLPRDEKVLVDCLQAIDTVRATSNSLYGESVLENGLQDLLSRDVYKAEDLLRLRLYFACNLMDGLKAGEIKESEYENILYFHEKLSSQIDKIEFDCLDLLRDSLLASLTCIEIMGLFHYFKRAVETLNKIGQKTRDFQKQPIVLMLEWKYYIQTDYDTAKQKYEEAKMMARMFGNEKLIVSLDNEWAEDIERYR
ncbi:XRE family transcriptional regulator [Streptococcus infantis]|uniref:helix-turn-helix domain-containing protein n=1 Tax=Streptococcus infantis TaxID=68892 RepID=UPI0039C06736